MVEARDPWPIGMFAYLAVDATAGSYLGQRMTKDGSLRSFFLSWALTSVILYLGGLCLDLCLRGPFMRSYYATWWLLVVVFVSCYGLAGTLIAFPMVGWTKELLQGQAQG